MRFMILLVAIGVVLVEVALGKGSGGGVKVGSVECPCFCSERSGAGFSPYWADNFGELDEGHGIECATSCGSTADDAELKAAMPFCGQYVDYTFCGRLLNPTLATEIGVNLTSQTGYYDYISYLDLQAQACSDDTPDIKQWAEETTCKQTVNKGACHVAFPKCSQSQQGQGLPICASFCHNERMQCRTDGSMFGPSNVVYDGCLEAGFVDMTGPSPDCTGEASVTHQRFAVALTLILGVVTMVMVLAS